MRVLCSAAVLFALICLGESYSKYGRTCKDIGCLSSEVCVMENDPCSYYQRENECGSYPTCKKVNSNSPPSCTNYICPPTKMCRLDGDTPKCVDEVKTDERLNGQNPSYNSNPNYQSNSGQMYPGYPTNGGSGGSAYPNVPNSHTTTTRAPMYRPSNGGGGGYQGGSIGSGYPGQPGQGYPGYPSQGSGGYRGGYPSQGGNGYSGYPSQNGNRYYPSGYPTGYQSGYPSQGSGYGGYNQNGGYRGGYQNGYPTQGGYQGGYQNGYQSGGRYGQKNTASTSSLDSITSQLKTLGLFCLLIKYLTIKIIGM